MAELTLDVRRASAVNTLNREDDTGPGIDFSVIVPIYNEEESVELLCERTLDVLRDCGKTFEIILVNDGSFDGTLAKLETIARGDARVKVVNMARNYGQTAALMAGIRVSIGDVLVPMDGDLQNDPGDIPRLLAKMDEGYDVVSGWRKNRQDKALSRKLPSVIANGLISKLLNVHLHDFGCTLKVYHRSVIQDVRLYGEMHRFIPVYAAWEGARVTEMEVNHHARAFGKSKYGLGRVTRVILDIFVLYFIDRALDRPIQFFGKFGLSFMAMSVLVFLWAVWLKLFDNTSLIQTPLPLLATTLGFAGLLFLLLGLIAEVLIRVYYESQDRFPFRIKSTMNLT